LIYFKRAFVILGGPNSEISLSSRAAGLQSKAMKVDPILMSAFDHTFKPHLRRQYEPVAGS
jgi:hypothetical protein